MQIAEILKVHVKDLINEKKNKNMTKTNTVDLLRNNLNTLEYKYYAY